MVATCAEPGPAPSERTTQRRLLVDAELAYRAALTDSLAQLPVGDRNLLRFHYFHGVAIEPLAALCCSSPPSVARQLARIRERLLREARRGLAARLPLGRAELDRLLAVARARFDLSIARVLRDA